jgi:hypothetical protein
LLGISESELSDIVDLIISCKKTKEDK